MCIVRSFYQLADGEWITSKSNPLSKTDAEFLKNRLYFHFKGLHDDGIVNEYVFTVEEVKNHD